RNWSPRHQTLAGGNGGLRHAPNGRFIFSLYRVHAQAGPGPGSADRVRSETHRIAIPGRSWASRRQPQYTTRVDSTVETQRGQKLPSGRAGRDERLVGGHGKTRDSARQAYETTSRGLGTW